MDWGFIAPFLIIRRIFMWELMSFFTGVLCGWAVIQGFNSY